MTRKARRRSERMVPDLTCLVRSAYVSIRATPRPRRALASVYMVALSSRGQLPIANLYLMGRSPTRRGRVSALPGGTKAVR